MREAIGSTWIMGIVLAFIALFSGYLAFSVNYSKAFRMKDGIIDIIEKHNGPNRGAIDDINDLMNQINYSSRGTCNTFFTNNTLTFIGVLRDQVGNRSDVGSGEEFNYCIQQVNTVGRNGQLSSSYFKVYVFFSIKLPMIRGALFNVSGETVNIFYPDADCMKGSC